ncbi:YceI family protein [Marinigracilibium pacificum]|uniref:YceI family protein n=1 Tax=Marinigracilibium pacificum TaxID=2729599 RepID=A0A848IW81_9BACT|nr:YceI family protein [Marinigracilibium pacificum]NMM48773.1 YceI family protein [Marinigracilibium pacificum]
MKDTSRITAITLMLLLLTAFNSQLLAQYKVDSKNSELTVLGTSSLHDWEIVAETLEGNANFDLTGGLKAVNNLSFDVVVNSMKSGKSGMDKNTYDALNEKKYKNVSYKLTKANKITPSGGKYKVDATGNLSIAGKSKSVNMVVTVTPSGSTVSIAGSYKMKMTDFGIDPPTAVFGTIKTGDEIEIKFNVNYIK